MIGWTSADEEGSPQQTIVNLLNEALATELICVLRYKAHYYASHGFAKDGDSIKLADGEFLEHVNEEQSHVDRLAERITQLGGVADFNPAILVRRGYSDYTHPGNPLDMLQEDLIAERITIDIYHEMIRFVATRDPKTRQLLEEILAREEEHAQKLATKISCLSSQRPARPAAVCNA